MLYVCVERKTRERDKKYDDMNKIKISLVETDQHKSSG